MTIREQVEQVLNESEQAEREHRRWRETHPLEAFSEDVNKSDAARLAMRTPAQIARAEMLGELDAEIVRLATVTHEARARVSAAIEADYQASLVTGATWATPRESRQLTEARAALEEAEHAEQRARVHRTQAASW